MTPAAHSDGRVQRRVNSRDRIVTALRELVREGVIAPSAEMVAGRAGVSARTVFRCFEDMESLYREIITALHAEFLPYATFAPDTPDRAERLRGLVAHRAEVFERILPFRQAADAHRHQSTALAEDHALLVSIERDRLKAIIDPAATIPPGLFEALCAVTAFDFWRRLRTDQHLSPARACDTMQIAAAAILSEAPESGPLPVSTEA